MPAGPSDFNMGFELDRRQYIVGMRVGFVLSMSTVPKIWSPFVTWDLNKHGSSDYLSTKSHMTMYDVIDLTNNTCLTVRHLFTNYFQNDVISGMHCLAYPAIDHIQYMLMVVDKFI